MSPVEAALDELRHALAEFVALLEREAHVLQTGRTDELAAVVGEKTTWSEAAAAAWNRLVATAGSDGGRGDTLDARLSGNPILNGSWQEVRQLAKQAERLNQGNNVLIEAQLQRTRMALDVLQSASHRGGLYGANGRLVDGFQFGHTLDKA